jgi:5S rRNA maturation endonuclease (ribonuclease M5)
MPTRSERQSEALAELEAVLRGEDEPIEFILVEGTRDVEALRFLGVTAPIDVRSHVRRDELAIAYNISTRTHNVLVLTDFDETGRAQAKRLTELLIAEGVHVQVELRRKISRLIGVLNLKTIESIDNLIMKKD